MITWTAPDGAALAPVPLVLPGLSLAVDPATPHRVVELAASRESLVDRAGIIGGISTVTALTTDPESLDRVTLSPIAARLATTVAVDRIHLGDLDEPLLQLDRSTALFGVNDHTGALSAYALAVSATQRIADRVDDNEIGGPLLAALLRAVTELGDAATDELRRSHERLRTRAQLLDDRLDLELMDLTAARTPALTLGADGHENDPFSLRFADLRILPARLLRFTGPDEPDLRIHAGGNGLLTVTAALRDTVIPDTEEVLGLFAIAADATTGAVVASAPVRLADQGIQADLYVPDYRPDEVNCALIGSETDPEGVRLDQLGSALTEIDRHLRYGWTMHRRAGAIRAAIDPAAQRRVVDSGASAAATAHDSARNAVADAQHLLRQEVRRTRDGGDVDSLRNYAVQVDSLAERIFGPPDVDGPIGPILTELAAETLR